MSDSESEFEERYLKDRPLYKAWGNFVTAQVTDYLYQALPAEVFDAFLKIPSQPRLKTLPSLLGKAFSRNKNYANPYEDITDKVGVRFVVLLLSHIKKVEEAVESSNFWIFSQDKHFEEERRKNPTVFDYQSVHYIVSSANDTLVDGLTIPKGIACEVQIRTLLQHAYSELSHDTIYKPKKLSTPEVLRNFAKSMALIETTDNLFEEVNTMLQRVNGTKLTQLVELYDDVIGKNQRFDQKSNLFLLDAFEGLIQFDANAIQAYFKSHERLTENIKNRSKHNFLYQQPVILLLYYLASTKRRNFRQGWPLTIEELRPIFTDLGFSVET